METERIAALLAVLEAGSLSAAAERLGYTPSGLSRAIAALEEETGLPLLRRGRWGVTPTDSCQRLLPYMRRLLSSADQYRQEADAIRGLEQGTLSIGSSYGSYYRVLAQLVAGFCQAHPGVRVELQQAHSSELAQALEEGRIDLCIISRREGSFDWLPLREDQLVAVIPQDHPCASLPAFPLERFAREPMIAIQPDAETDNARLFRHFRIRPQFFYSCADYAAALTMVEAGLGITMVNQVLLENWTGRAIVLPLDPPQTVELGIAVPSLDAASPAARQFIAHTRCSLSV